LSAAATAADYGEADSCKGAPCKEVNKRPVACDNVIIQG